MVGTVATNMSTRPASNSTVAGPLPLKGTCDLRIGELLFRFYSY